MKTVLFERHFARFAGHHLKVWDYFNHVLASRTHTARVRFTPQSLLDDTNPWTAVPELILDRSAGFEPDVHFLSGMDWARLDAATRADSPAPVINLVQHPTHFDPGNPRYAFLANRAIRICVSEEMAEAVEATGKTRGPLFTIPNGIDVRAVRDAAAAPERDIDLLIAGLKNPALGRRLAASMDRAGRRVRLIDSRLRTRAELLGLMGRAQVTVFLPWPEEGFYLPALEGMAAGTIVVCPDVFGNRSFCIPDVTCFRPAYEEDALRAAAERALGELARLEEMRAEASRTVERHDLANERAAFLEILARVDELWEADAD